MLDRNREFLSSEVQRLLQLLHMNTSIYNIETRVGTDGKAYIMEVFPSWRWQSPIRNATLCNRNRSYKKCRTCSRWGNNPPYSSLCFTTVYWSEIILHADKTGIFKDIQIEQNMKENHIIETDLWVQPGDLIHSFNGANDAIGTLVVSFNNEQQQHKNDVVYQLVGKNHY